MRQIMRKWLTLIDERHPDKDTKKYKKALERFSKSFYKNHIVEPNTKKFLADFKRALDGYKEK